MKYLSKPIVSVAAAAALSVALPAGAGGQSRVPEPGSPATRPIQPLPEIMKPTVERFLRSVCAVPTSAGTMHNNSVTVAETWTEAGSPYSLPYDINVSAPLTIEPCAVVRIAAGKTITIKPGGAFIAAGQDRRPVTIERVTGGMAWTQIRALGGDLSLTHAVVSGGGASASAPALVALAAALHVQSGSLHVDDVEIVDSQSQGVLLDGTGGFDASSQNLRIRGAAGFPINVFARFVGSIPSGQYTGNGRDAIGIAGAAAGGALLFSQTMRNHGVPYHVGTGQNGGRLDVSSQSNGAVAVLTVDPGVIIQFPPAGMLFVAGRNATNGPALGALIANGAGAPIVFTSDQNAALVPGGWIGIRIGDPVDPRTVLQNVKVMFAGAADSAGSNSCPYPGFSTINDAAIRILGVPSTQFITNSEIIASARMGIDRGWRSDIQPDFLPSNAFTAVASCKQTTPRMTSGACPINPPCP